MAIFRRKKDTTETIPELEEYYASERRERSGVAWLLALASLIGTVLVVLAIFFGARWLYRTITNKDDKKSTTSTSSEISSNGSTQSSGSTSQTNSSNSSSTSNGSTGTSSTSTNTPSQTSTPSTTAPSTSSGQPSSSTSSTGSSSPSTSTTGTTGQSTPGTGGASATQVANTGPGDLIAPAIGVMFIATFAHYLNARRKALSKKIKTLVPPPTSTHSALEPVWLFSLRNASWLYLNTASAYRKAKKAEWPRGRQVIPAWRGEQACWCRMCG